MIAERIQKEIDARLGFLENVGLDYLTLFKRRLYAVRAARLSAFALPLR